MSKKVTQKKQAADGDFYTLQITFNRKDHKKVLEWFKQQASKQPTARERAASAFGRSLIIAAYHQGTETDGR